MRGVRAATGLKAGVPVLGSWRGVLLALLVLHACWLLLWAAFLRHPDDLSIPLPGFGWGMRSKVTAGRQGQASAGIGAQLAAAAAPVRSCPLEVDWSGLKKDPNKNRAAVYTRYNIVFGGGERYLLSVVLVMQEMGYSVDVLVLPDNQCQTKEFLLGTAAGLRIKLDPQRVSVVAVQKDDTKLAVPKGVYSLFMSLGNEKVPQVDAIGHVSFFMCQFPFDAHDFVEESNIRALTTYDYVILNSRFSYRWWQTYMDALYSPALERYGAMPHVEVLHPPVDAFMPDSLDDLAILHHQQQQRQKQRGGRAASGALFSGDASSLLSSFDAILASLSEATSEQKLAAARKRFEGGGASIDLGGGEAGKGEGGGEGAAGRRRHIAMVGRIVQARQTKGHGKGVELFRSILPKLPKGTELHIVGNLMAGPEHAELLQQTMKKAIGLPVKFHVGVSSRDVEAVLHTALVQWHLTGVGLEPGQDPGNEEHFGISVAEGMSAGCIPVVLRRGGVEDIVVHSVNGFLGPELSDVAKHTLEVFGMSHEEQAKLRTQAIRDVTKFSHPTFSKRFKAMAQRGALSKPHRHMMNDTRDVVLARTFELPSAAPNVALIVLQHKHPAFEYVLKNVLYHLEGSEDSWGLYVVHGPSVTGFVDRAMRGITGAQVWQMDTDDAVSAALSWQVDIWQFVSAQRVLVFSPESLLLQSSTSEFGGFDYVASPACTAQKSSLLPAAALPLHSSGLGGLSLRSVAAMRGGLGQELDALEQQQQQQQGEGRAGQLEALLAKGAGQEQEQGQGAYNLPSRATAYRFAVEVPCADLEGSEDASGGGRKGGSGGRKAKRRGHPLHTLPQVPLGLQAAWYHFWESSPRYHDLLKLLDMSVCGYG